MQNNYRLADVLAGKLRIIKTTYGVLSIEENEGDKDLLPPKRVWKRYSYMKPSDEVQESFRKLLMEIGETTEFAYGKTYCEKKAYENLRAIFLKLPPLPKGKKYGFTRDTFFTLPMLISGRDILRTNMSPWLKAQFEEEE